MPIEDCLIADETANRIISSVKRLVIKYHIGIFDEHALRDDLRYLTKYYKVESIQPVDMFPYTEHVETVVCLSNKNAKPKDYVEIGLDAEEYYRIKDSKRKF